MSKNKEMLKIFWKAILGNKEAISLVIPKHYVKNIYEIDYENLKNQGIKYLIYDIDNTILPVNEIDVPAELKSLFSKLKKDFTICLFSNNDRERVQPVIKQLQIDGIWRAEKPSQFSYEKLKQKLNVNKKNTAIIGDQMLSDIVFGNKYEFFTILVEPYKKKYDKNTGINRILSDILMKKLKNKITRYHYY